jgi:hypothetical protein
MKKIKSLKQFESFSDRVDEELATRLHYRETPKPKDKVVEMYISDFDIDEYIDHRLVVKTQSGKTFYIKAGSDSPLFEED